MTQSTNASTCSRSALVQNLALVLSHLSARVEEVISHGHPNTPRAATLARLVASASMSHDMGNAVWQYQLALEAVRKEKPLWDEELLRSLFDLFLMRFEKRSGTLDQSLALAGEMIPLLDKLEKKYGHPPLGVADLLHLSSYMLSVQGKYSEAATALSACIAIRKKHLPLGSRIVAQNELTLRLINEKETK